jgi:hypothetical protein
VILFIITLNSSKYFFSVRSNFVVCCYLERFNLENQNKKRFKFYGFSRRRPATGVRCNIRVLQLSPGPGPGPEANKYDDITVTGDHEPPQPDSSRAWPQLPEKFITIFPPQIANSIVDLRPHPHEPTAGRDTSQPSFSNPTHSESFHSYHSYPFPTLALAGVDSNSFLSCRCALSIRTRPLSLVSVCALDSACHTLTHWHRLAGLSLLDRLPRARPAAQPPYRPANAAPNFDHFRVSTSLGPGPPPVPTTITSRRTAQPVHSDPRLRHFEKAGLSTPGPGLGWHPSHSRSQCSRPGQAIHG